MAQPNSSELVPLPELDYKERLDRLKVASKVIKDAISRGICTEGSIVAKNMFIRLLSMTRDEFEYLKDQHLEIPEALIKFYRVNENISPGLEQEN